MKQPLHQVVKLTEARMLLVCGGKLSPTEGAAGLKMWEKQCLRNKGGLWSGLQKQFLRWLLHTPIFILRVVDITGRFQMRNQTPILKKKKKKNSAGAL